MQDRHFFFPTFDMSRLGHLIICCSCMFDVNSAFSLFARLFLPLYNPTVLLRDLNKNLLHYFDFELTLNRFVKQCSVHLLPLQVH